jgi:ketosteroid isomerase-like protein
VKFDNLIRIKEGEMSRIVFAVGLVVLVLGVAILAQTQSENVEQELTKLEKEWGDAEVKRDIAFFDLILADEYMFTNPQGAVWTKAQYIASLKSGDLRVISSVLDEIKVNVYGDSAVCFGRVTGRAQLKGKDISSQYRFTDTWVKRAGRWQCVADHSSEIAQK